MRIPTWRLVLTGGVVIGLAAAGIGLVAAASAPPAPATNPAQAEATHAPDSSDHPDRPFGKDHHGGHERWGPKLLRIGRHLVHVEATVTDKDGNLVVVWLDHGTVASVAGGTLTISETGGTSKSVSIDAETKIRNGRADGSLGNLKAGVEVFVQSRVENGNAVAKRVLIIPAGTFQPEPSPS